MKKIYLISGIVAVAITIIVIGYFSRYKSLQENNLNLIPDNNLTETQKSAELQTNQNKMHIVTLKTNFGEIQFETYDADAPKTVW